MAFVGLDIEQMRSLAKTFTTSAERLDAAANALDGQLSHTAWQGPDSAKFQGDWRSTHRSALHRAATSLRDAGVTLARQADQQQTASRADGGTAAGGHQGSAFAGAHASGTGKVPPKDILDLLRTGFGNIADDVMKGGLLADIITKGLGFQYVGDGQDFYTTNQDSIQSHAGFMDAFDDAGPLLGMNLDDSISRFTYGGTEYRLELWKGSYGAESAFGGEVGWYMRPAGSGVGDFYPAADDSHRLHMVQTIYNVDTGTPYFTSDGHKTLGEDQFWNLAIRTDPGVTKDMLGQRAELSGFGDVGLRDALVAEMQKQPGIRVWTDPADNDKVYYDWH